MKDVKIKAAIGIGSTLLVIVLLVFFLNSIEDKYIYTAQSSEAGKESSGTYKKTNYLEIGKDYYKYTDDCESYLLVGTDGSGNENADDESYRGSMADFLLLMVLNKTTNQYGFIQIDRDTICDVTEIASDGTGEGMEKLQICTAHWYGKDKEQSAENTVTSVSLLLGELDIDGYYVIGMDDIGFLNHLIGGVKVLIEDDFGEDSSLKEGEEIELSDSQAEEYVRGRMSVGDGENRSRMRRQRTYMEAYLEKAKDIIDKDPSMINDFFEGLSNMATTDINGNKVSKIVNYMSKMDSLGIMTFDGKSKTGSRLGDGLEHAEFHADRDSIIEVLTKLYNLEIDNE